jgi:hypothetical protein
MEKAKNLSMKVYYFTQMGYVKNVFADYTSKKVNLESTANMLLCPAVRDTLKNTWAVGSNKSFQVNYDGSSSPLYDGLDSLVVTRKPSFKETNIFNIKMSSYFFSEEPLMAKMSAPYFHQVEYQKVGTFVGGKYNIGKWIRPLEAEIMTWNEKGMINFIENQPIYYIEFLTDEKIELIPFQMTDTLVALSSALINSPLQSKENLQGSLTSRYEAFERSSYKEAILEEIKANLVSEDEASPTV